nr:hypothetical protein [Candidatus Burkholderia verschuerenii]
MGATVLAKLASKLERDLLDTGDTARTLASVAENVPRMQRLLAASAERLTNAFAHAKPASREPAYVEPIADDAWRDRLHAIVTLLDSSNLQAIALSENLSPHTPDTHRADFERFLARVRALDFPRASAIARELLEQA